MEDLCKICGVERYGGIWTNGDGYGDAKYVGIVTPPWAGYCWECYGKVLVPDLNKQIDKAFADAGMCGFLKAWIGRCRNPKPCQEHINEKCWKCKEPATSQCGSAGSLVCGMPQCNNHPHIHKAWDSNKELNHRQET